MNVTRQNTLEHRASVRRRILARQLADQVLAAVTGGCTTIVQGRDGVWRNDKIEL